MGESRARIYGLQPGLDCLEYTVVDHFCMSITCTFLKWYQYILKVRDLRI